jgi:rubrerythrin
MGESTQQHTLEELFERAIQIENQAASIYRELERRFSHHQESVSLWKALAADEDMHAEVLAKALGDAPSERLACQAPDDVWAAVTHILNLLSQDLLSSIENLKDAYELAHELEHSEVNAVFEFLSVDAVPGNVEREFVRTHITAHQKRLTDFLQTYSGRDWSEVIPQ